MDDRGRLDLATVAAALRSSYEAAAGGEAEGVVVAAGIATATGRDRAGSFGQVRSRCRAPG